MPRRELDEHDKQAMSEGMAIVKAGKNALHLPIGKRLRRDRQSASRGETIVDNKATRLVEVK